LRGLLKYAPLILLLGLIAFFLIDFRRQNQAKLLDLHRMAQELVLKTEPKLSESDWLSVAFGKRLFFDPRLSSHQQVSCATCHKPELAFTDGLALATGQAQVQRNTMPIFNMWLLSWFFWDGRSDSLISQVQGPMFHPHEHGLSRESLAQAIATYHRTEYEALFGPLPSLLKPEPLSPSQQQAQAAPIQVAPELAAYALTSLGSGDWIAQSLALRQKHEQANVILEQIPGYLPGKTFSPTLSAQPWDHVDTVVLNISRAIANFERTIVAKNSPFDQFVSNWLEPTKPQKAWNESFTVLEFEGFQLFAGRAQCSNCHFGPNFSDGQFHNIGLPALNQRLDLGRALGVQMTFVDRLGCEILTVKSPTTFFQEQESCREKPFLDRTNLELLGAFKTPSLRQLKQTKPYMHDGRFTDLDQVIQHYNDANSTPAVGHREETLQPLKLKPAELKALKAFLESLNGEIAEIPPPPLFPSPKYESRGAKVG
jgi:cytochrome c peroxidase